jgi:hypothetical protein
MGQQHAGVVESRRAVAQHADAPAREAQVEPWFHEQVNRLQAQLEGIEAAASRPGN